MSHEIETNGTQAAAIFAREDAWHQLGTTLPDAFTAQDAMTIGRLGGWNVRKTPLTTTEITEDGVATIEIPDKFATVRTNPFNGNLDYLGIVGPWYTPIQNEEHCDFLNTLVDESGAHFDTAGSLRGGRDVFVTMKLPTTMMVGGVDQLDLYIAAFNSHDGTSAFRLMTTPVRVVCANTQRLALQQNNGIFRIRHTRGAQGQIEQARQGLGLTFKYLEAFEAEAERMVQETLTHGQFMDIISREFGAADDASKRAKTNAERVLDDLQQLFADANTQAGIRNTRWAGYQSLIEYADHIAPVRGDEKARAERVLSGGVDDFKQRAHALFAVA